VPDICKNSDDMDDAEQIWEGIMASYKPAFAVRFFIVVDGLSNKAAETLNMIVQQLAHPENGQNTDRLQI
jgi:hypothetical protein